MKFNTTEIKRIRESKKETQAAMSERCGKSRSYWALIENGHYRPSVGTLAKDFLRAGVDLDELNVVFQ